MNRWLAVGGAMCMGMVASWTHAGVVGRSLTPALMAPDAVQFMDQGEIPVGHVLFGLTAPTADLPAGFDLPDTMIATLRTADTARSSLASFAFTVNDDFSPGLGSLFRFRAPATDDYSVAVTGFPDGFNDLGHSEAGRYYLALAHVDPATPGGDFPDTDGTNETMTGADVLTLPVGDARAAVNSLAGTASDVDFYRVDLDAGDVLAVMTAPLAELATGFDRPDTFIVLFDDQGTIVQSSDDAGDKASDYTDPITKNQGLGSALLYLAPSAGPYYVAVTGFPDALADGSHTVVGDYGLIFARMAAQPLPGDADHDGDVDAFDLTAVNQNFGQAAGLAATGPAGNAGAVPEPASATLLVLGGLAGLRRRPPRFSRRD